MTDQQLVQGGHQQLMLRVETHFNNQRADSRYMPSTRTEEMLSQGSQKKKVVQWSQDAVVRTFD